MFVVPPPANALPSASAPPALAPSILGSWAGTKEAAGVTMTFRPDGTVSATTAQGTTNATFTLVGNVLTTIPEKGKGNPSTDTVSIEGNTLTLSGVVFVRTA